MTNSGDDHRKQFQEAPAGSTSSISTSAAITTTTTTTPGLISTGPINFKRSRTGATGSVANGTSKTSDDMSHDADGTSSSISDRHRFRGRSGASSHQAVTSGDQGDAVVIEDFENMSIDDEQEEHAGSQMASRQSSAAVPSGSVRRSTSQRRSRASTSTLAGNGAANGQGNSNDENGGGERQRWQSNGHATLADENDDDDVEQRHQHQQQRANGESSGSGHQQGQAANKSRRQQSKRRKVHVCHVEVRLSPFSNLLQSTVTSIVRAYILDTFDRLEVGAELDGWKEEVQALTNDVDRIVVAECGSPDPFPYVSDLRLEVHVYRSSGRAALDQFAASTGDDDDDEPNVMAATVRDLPSRELDGLWDTLVYDEDIKPRLLDYIHTTLLFSDSGVDFDVVTWNRLVLLHGPPGTGKTSLCRALAQKLAIRLSSRYSSGKLVEINSHSLFSKWFSESGKLVQRLFSRVTEMMEDESCFVVVLIDEVESLTAARAGAMSGTEPSDALRVVNALLTQLDQLKRRKNALVMSTSNIAQAIDSAFVDRADIKQYIGLPPPRAIHWVLRGCLQELMRAGIVRQQPLLDWAMVEAVRDKPSSSRAKEAIRKNSVRLVDLAERCKGMSGRTLRRLPVLAHARYIGTTAADGDDDDASSSDDDHEAHDGDDAPTAGQWIAAMERVIGDEQEQIGKLEELVGTGKV